MQHADTATLIVSQCQCVAVSACCSVSVLQRRNTGKSICISSASLISTIFLHSIALFIIPYLSISISKIGSAINFESKLINSAVSEVILKQIKTLIRIKFINKHYSCVHIATVWVVSIVLFFIDLFPSFQK